MKQSLSEIVKPWSKLSVRITSKHRDVGSFLESWYLLNWATNNLISRLTAFFWKAYSFSAVKELANSMVQDVSWKVDSSSAGQEIG
jgi:hypothetical protein